MSSVFLWNGSLSASKSSVIDHTLRSIDISVTIDTLTTVPRFGLGRTMNWDERSCCRSKLTFSKDYQGFPYVFLHARCKMQSEKTIEHEHSEYGSLVDWEESSPLYKYGSQSLDNSLTQAYGTSNPFISLSSAWHCNWELFISTDTSWRCWKPDTALMTQMSQATRYLNWFDRDSFSIYYIHYFKLLLWQGWQGRQGIHDRMFLRCQSLSSKSTCTDHP